jgi:hypothetical protein
MNSKWLHLLVCTLGFAFPAQASFITIETVFRVTETGNGPMFSVSTKNRGDEPAYKLQLEVTALAQQFTGSRVQKLDVDQTIETEFRVGEIFERPGHYPIVIRTHYQDANGYPFSALAAGFYDAGGAELSKVLLRANPVTIPANGKGRLETVVRNNDAENREVSLRLYLPDELVALQDSVSLDILPNSAEIVVFEIENFSALANSGYSIILVAGYEAQGRHYGSTTSTRVHISEPATMVNYSRLIPWLFAGMTLLVVLLILAKRSKAGR